MKGRTHDVPKIAPLRHRQQNRQLGAKPTFTVATSWLITARRLLHAGRCAAVSAAALPRRRHNSPGLSPVPLPARLSLADVCRVVDPANEHEPAKAARLP